MDKILLDDWIKVNKKVHVYDDLVIQFGDDRMNEKSMGGYWWYGKRGVRASWGKVWGRQERGGSKLGKGLGQASHEKVTPKKSDKEVI
ncbi:hypothetical protein V6N12_058235 [Hibiscus sabdariffa]|uniref:Uncharacterized protein n=1 Tax=Hibiscus sabdariffa TaxID=183260 RepID=A0ABR2ERL4_9ROSI